MTLALTETCFVNFVHELENEDTSWPSYRGLNAVMHYKRQCFLLRQHIQRTNQVL